jgi:hypothetical protein
VQRSRRAFLSRPDETITGAQLVGTVVLDDRRVVVVLREVRTGDLHRIVNDAEEFLSELPGEDVARRMEELMDGVLNYESYRLYRGRDLWGAPQWDDPTDAEVRGLSLSGPLRDTCADSPTGQVGGLLPGISRWDVHPSDASRGDKAGSGLVQAQRALRPTPDHPAVVVVLTVVFPVAYVADLVHASRAKGCLTTTRAGVEVLRVRLFVGVNVALRHVEVEPREAAEERHTGEP